MSRTVPYARQNCTSVCAADKIWIRFGIWACKNKTALFYVRPTQLAIRWGERKPWTSSEQVSSSDLRTSHHVWFRQSRSFACDFGTQLGWESSNVCDRLPLLNKYSIFYFFLKTTTYPPLQPRSSLTVISSVVLIHPVPLDHPAYKAGRGVTLRALAWSHMHPVFTAAHTNQSHTGSLLRSHTRRHTPTKLQIYPACKSTVLLLFRYEYV